VVAPLNAVTVWSPSQTGLATQVRDEGSQVPVAQSVVVAHGPPSFVLQLPWPSHVFPAGQLGSSAFTTWTQAPSPTRHVLHSPEHGEAQHT